MNYHFVGGELLMDQPPDVVEWEEWKQKMERHSLTEKGVIGEQHHVMPAGGMNRGYAGPDAWKRLLPPDYEV